MIKLLNPKKLHPALIVILALILAASGCFSGCGMKKSASSTNSGSAKSLDGNLYQATASNGYFLSLSFKNGQFKFSDNLSSFHVPNDKACMENTALREIP